MNLVEEIARMIDDEGAYSVASTGTDGGEPIPFTTRQKYFQAKYECRAIELLKKIGGLTSTAIRTDLIEWEMRGWKGRGMPVDDPVLSKIIADKYV